MILSADRPLHILFITNNYTPYRGGVVSSIVATRAQLERMGHRVTIVTLDFKQDSHQDEVGVMRLWCPIRFTYKKNSMAIAWRPYRQIRTIIGQIQPDIVHTHHPFVLGVSALHAARAANLPVVFTYHTLYHQYTHYVPLPSLFTRWLVTRLVNAYCRAVDAIVAPSEYVKEYLQAQGITTPVAVVPTGIQSPFVADKNVVRVGTTGEPFHLLCVSRFVPEKNIRMLLDIFAHLVRVYPTRRFMCTLIGYGYEFEALRTYAYQTLQLSPAQLVFVHEPPQETIADYYRTAHLFVFTSHTDTQGLVLAEAMAGGMPVVALEGPGQRSIVRNGYNGFLVDTAHDMVGTIESISQNKELYQRLSRGAWQTAQEYTGVVLTKKLVSVYRSV